MEMTEPRVLVLTGVENSGKTTTAEALAKQTGWPLVREFARTHPDVLHGQATVETLKALHLTWKTAVQQAKSAAPRETPWVICDTGPLVLEVWAGEVFGVDLQLSFQEVGLFVLCETLRDWHPDPLRSLPDFEDRLALQALYAQRLKQLDASGAPYISVASDPAQKSRVEQIVDAAFNIL
jgi:nicotinamide riboside kinase